MLTSVIKYKQFIIAKFRNNKHNAREQDRRICYQGN